jgi:hypothetical protein
MPTDAPDTKAPLGLEYAPGYMLMFPAKFIDNVPAAQVEAADVRHPRVSFTYLQSAPILAKPGR